MSINKKERTENSRQRERERERISTTFALNSYLIFRRINAMRSGLVHD